VTLAAIHIAMSLHLLVARILGGSPPAAALPIRFGLQCLRFGRDDGSGGRVSRDR
jgi:hypothetical protein